MKTNELIRVSGLITGQVVSWFHKELMRSNQCCLYCGRPLAGSQTLASSKEHLIGRRFVPKGSLHDSFNFIFRTCCLCNNRKSNTERHISAVTLFSSSGRVEDNAVDACARNKAQKDFHPEKPGTVVERASEQITARFRRPGLGIEFHLTAPPRISSEMLDELSFNQIQALFSLATSEDYLNPKKTWLLPYKHFYLHGAYIEGDWGNPEIVEVTKRVAEWPAYACIRAANGYFKAILRKDETKGWFWALEWNRYLRVFGAICGEKPPPLYQDLPDLKWFRLSDSVRSRTEVPLAPNSDSLFDAQELTSKN